MGKIKSGNPFSTAGKIQQRTPLTDENLLFSFLHLDLLSNSKFCLDRCQAGYLEKLLERLKSLNAMTVREFKGSKSKSIRAHPHDWGETTEKLGFQFLNQQLRDLPGWQFQITSNDHGRVHGFLIDRTFFVVWLDPDHLMYS